MAAQGTDDWIHDKILRLRGTIETYRRDGMALEAAILEQWVYELKRCRNSRQTTLEAEISQKQQIY